MNRNRYRLVFNKLRGLLMAVAETATGQGKHPSESRQHGESFDDCLFGLLTRTRRGGACLLLGVAVLQAMPLQALAQIAVDRNAPKSQQPTVLNAANGVPQINIQTPNGNGVSRNTYTQFDVLQNGVILNNSRNDTQTQLGGWVQGNPWLAAGTAKVILNEVNSNNPSLLKGYIEVAGDRAQVVIANPSGISCDGCGFVNANRATLTTGTPIMNGGSLDAYRVQGGTIGITGAGMDASRTDYTDLIARAVQINAGVWANNLKVTAGANQVSADHTSATPIVGTGSAPTFAIDVAALGGMYAGKIMLVGTEAGVGVRNAGQIGASAGEVVVTAEGLLINSSKITSTATTSLQTKDGVQNSGTLMAGTDLTVTTQGDLQNTGALMAHGNAAFTANGATSKITGSAGSVVAAGVQSDGTLGTQGNLNLAATQSISANGQIVAGGDQTLQAASIDLSNSQIGGRNVSLSATQDNAKLTGATVSASQTLTIATPQTLQSDGATISANQLSLSAHDLSNVGGTLLQVGSGDLAIQLPGTLDNTQGRIGTNSQNFSISAGTLTNTQGRLEHAGTGTMTLNAANYAGTQGTITSNGTLNLTATTATLDGGSVSAQQLGITANILSNRGGVIAQLGSGQATLTATTALDNAGGTVGSNGSLLLHTGILGNVGGTLQALTDLTINATGAVDNSAPDASTHSLITVGGNAQITASQLNNTLGKINVVGNGQWTITGALLNRQGRMTVGQNLSLSAATLDNTQGVLGAVAGNANLTISGLLTNTSGWMEASGQMTLDTQGLANGNGTILGKSLGIESHGQAIGNQGGAIIATGDTLRLNSGALTNDGGLIQAKGALTLNTGALSNKNAGSTGGILGLANVSITSSSLDNTSGYVAGSSDVAISASGNLINSQGAIASGGKLQMTGTGLSNGGGQIQAVGDLSIGLGTGTLDNTAGLIRSSGLGTLSAATVINRNTQPTSQPTAQTTNLGLEGQSLTVTATRIDNTAGALRASDTISLTATNALDNTTGLISADNTLQIRDANPTNKVLSITNTQGTLFAGQQLTIDTASLSGDGDVLSGGNIGIGLTQDYTHSGNLKANGDISLTIAGATSTLQNQGLMQAGRTLALQAGTLNNQAAGTLKGSTLQLRATDTHTFTNRGLINGSDTFIDAIPLNNLGTGRIYGDHIALSATTLNNTAESGNTPVIAARNRLDIGATTINNSDGALIYSAGNMAIGAALDSNHLAIGTAGALTNSSATIEADGNLTINTTQLINKRTRFSTAQTITSEGAEYAVLAWGTAGPQGILLGSWATNTDTTVAIDSGVGRIAAGGNMTLGGTVTNDKSDILAGGSIALDQARYTGIAQQGQTLKSAIGATLLCTGCAQGGAMTYNGYYVLGDVGGIPGDWTARNHILSTVFGIGGLKEVITPSVLYGWSKTGVQFITQTIIGYTNGTTDPDGNAIIYATDLGGMQPVYTYSDIRDSLTFGELSGYSASNIVLNNYSLAPAHLTANKSITGTATQIANLNVGGTVGQIGSGAKSASVTVGTGKTFTPIAQVTVPNSSGGTPGSGTVIRSGGINLSLPTNSLYTIHPGGSSAPLIETDPKFTDHHAWLSSDYMLTALSLDPALTQKRLGDGFYEQKLIRDQVAQLTGRRFLDGYASDEAEYQSLMNAGVTFAKAHKLVPGVALSAEQMAQLTSDIVWLVEQTVTLPDGTQQKVLVPQLYVQVKEGDLSNDGALIAANDISLKVSGDLNNGGTIAGRKLVDLSANNINLDGRIKGDRVGLTTANDINVTGGEVRANSVLVLDAGRDINVTSTTTDFKASSAHYLHTTTTVDRVAGLYVTGSDGTLVAQAGRDMTLTGAQVDSAGTASLNAKGNLSLNTLATQETLNFQRDADNYNRRKTTNEAGTSINAQGDLSLKAGSDLTARAANISSTNGAITLAAGQDIKLISGEATLKTESASKDISSGNFSTTTTSDRHSTFDTQALSTTVSGNSITATSGRDLQVKGSNVVATQDASLTAVGKLNIEAAEETHTHSDFHSENMSGLFNSGFGVTWGSQDQIQLAKGESTTHTASTVGSVQGNVTLKAGTAYSQMGSDVTAPAGDVSITAPKVDIGAVYDTTKEKQTTEFNQSGLSLTVSSPVLSAIQSIRQMDKAKSQTKDPRMKALATANQAFAAKGAADAVQAGQGDANGQVGTGQTGADGKEVMRDGNAADKVGGAKLMLTLGSSSSVSESTQTSSTAQGSTVLAGNNLTIKATGGDLNAIGSTLKAGNDAALSATGNVNLIAAENTNILKSTQSNDSGYIGIGLGYGKQNGFTLELGFGTGQGWDKGNDKAYTFTTVSAGNKASLTSGLDANLIGTSVSGREVLATIGGSLNIVTPQMVSNYASDSSSAGFAGSLCTIYCTGQTFVGSANGSMSKVNSQYQSAVNMAGIQAGDGGFQVKVGGNTDLKGSVIASTDKAVQDGKNSFSTGGKLTFSNLDNKAEYSAESASGTIGTDSGSAGFGSDSGQASSTTLAGISGIAGSKAVRTGDGANGIAKIFDVTAVKNEVNAQTQITQAFGQNASTAIGNYANSKVAEAESKQVQSQVKSLQAAAAERAGDTEKAAQLTAESQALATDAQSIRDLWGETGTARLGLHALAAGLTGGAQGAAGTLASTLALPEIKSQLDKAGLSDATQKAILTAASAGIGAAVGDTSGAAGALNEATNNYLTSTQTLARDKELAACKTLACSSSVQLKYLALNGMQDTGLLVGVGGGIGYQAYQVGASMVDMVKNLPETIQALTALVSDPSFRAKVGDAVANDYAQRINNLNQAYNDGGWDGSVTAGVEAGRLAVDVVTAAQAAMGAAKLTATVVKAGAGAIAGDVVQVANIDLNLKAVSSQIDSLLMNASTKLGQNVDDIAASLARNSTKTAGNADRVVLGKWEGENAGYVGEAKANGGVWYQTDIGVFEKATQGLSDAEKSAVMWKVNEAFLKQQLQAGTPKIEFIGLGPDQILSIRPDSFAAKEVLFLQQNASSYGYIRSGSAWVKK